MRRSLDLRLIRRASLRFTDVSRPDVEKTTTMNRRSLLTNGLMAAAWAATAEFASPWSRPNPVTPSGPLKAAAATCGIKVGAQAGKATLQFPDFVQAIKDNFNMLTPGNELKWPRLQPSPGSFDFTDADWMVNFCESNGLLVHGHNLCWNSPSGNPNWFKTTLDKSNAARFLTEHITTVMRHYAGRIDSWDVVNEPTVFWSKRSDGLYPGVWVDLLGPTYIDTAFHAAAAADPKALLVLNVYDVEQGTPDHETTRGTTIALLKQLLARGVPVHAVGMESHLDASTPPGGVGLSTFIQQIRDMGLQVLITELDVNDTHLDGSFQARDQVIAQMYRDYLLQVVPASGAKRVIFWTPSDKWDWLNSTNIPQFRREDGTPHRPGLFTDTMARKSAFGAVESSLRDICANDARR
jgi:endo-1,4-beta-xylanase